jgi:hypothetical protein
MSNTKQNEVRHDAGVAPKTVGCGKGGPGATGHTVTRLSRPRRTRSTGWKLRKPRLPRPAYRKLTQYATQFADQLNRDGLLSPLIRADLRAFREDLLFAVKRQFKLKAGRPSDPLIDTACELVREGKSVPRVLREQIKNWDTLDAYTRYLASKGLRQAVARREKQHKGRSGS